MATPNYGYEKRQRELAKKNKKAEKLREKAQRKSHPDDPVAADSDAPSESVAASIATVDAQ